MEWGFTVPTRQGLIEDLMDFGHRVPPRVGIALAALSWMIFHVVAAQTIPIVGRPPIGNLSAGLQLVIYFSALFLQFAIPFCLLVGVTVSVIKRRRARKVYATARANPNSAISGMSWREFERLVGEAFRQQGFSVLELGGGGPDGGVDLVLNKDGKRYLGQCKHWKAWQVGVAVVRELNGVIAAQKADGGYVITGGVFTEDARIFADSCGIHVIDGPKLDKMIRSVSAVAETRRSHSADEIPNCPECGAAMRERTANQGQFKGQPFWGCTTYPKCGGIVHIERVA
jgi:restriction system protein